MSATAGLANRSTLTALTANLDIDDVADPALRSTYFQYMTDLSDANWSDYAANKFTLNNMDEGEFTDPYIAGVSFNFDEGVF
jgi:hypothetical protein